MPDAADYREAARLLARTADEVRGINQPVEAGFGPTVLDGGELGRSTGRFIDDAGRRAAAIAAELDELSIEADRLSTEAASAAA